ncbi:MAG: 30S ribosomal protein S9 [bacterium]|nr:30S ribosomal protein S9 [bacterium]
MATKQDTYIESVGRRKTATARVRITVGAKENYAVNNKPLNDYFVTKEQQAAALRPLAVLKEKEIDPGVFGMTVLVTGSGVASQAGAVAHGLARALVSLNTELRGELKRAGLLTRDSRLKERRKFGLKKARKAPQWSKR